MKLLTSRLFVGKSCLAIPQTTLLRPLDMVELSSSVIVMSFRVGASLGLCMG